METKFGNTSGSPRYKICATAPPTESHGVYIGTLLKDKIIVTRYRVNEFFYGVKVTPSPLLKIRIPIQPVAQPLYDVLIKNWKGCC